MESSDFIKSFGDLGARVVGEYNRNMKRYTAFLSGLTKRPPEVLTVGELPTRYANFVQTEGPNLAGQVAAAGLTYYRAVIDGGIDAANRYFEQVLGIAVEPGLAKVDRPTPSTLLFRGRHGDMASNAFLVSNHRSEPVEVSFDIAEVASENGESRFRPTVTFSPASCRLGPNAEQVVQCTILLSDPFRAGETYVGQIQAVGFPMMAMRVSVRIDAAGRDAAARTPAAKPTAAKPRAKSLSTAKRARLPRASTGGAINT